MNTVKPFLRWAGGKSWFLNQIKDFVPVNFNNYHEPFLGGASIFFYLKCNGYITRDAYLYDLNSDLINAYQILKDQPEPLIELLNNFKNDSDCYYSVRSSKPTCLLEQAAKFIYLNRTSYNGIYRVNAKGEYNVPFGRRNLSVLFEDDTLRLASENLQQVFFSAADFFDSVEKIKKGDFVFLDPPYTIAHENNGFIEYNQRIFAWEDQLRLKEYMDNLNQIGAYYLLTNAAHESIHLLYKNSGIKTTVSRFSTVGSKVNSRQTCNEFIYVNF